MILGLALLTGPVEAAERRFAVVIGSDRGDVDEETLRFAETDADRMAQVLEKLGGVEPADLTLLHEPSADTVRRTLDEVGARIAATEDHAVVFVYYSGHADAQDLHLAGTRLPLEELHDTVEDMSADVRLLVLDACRSGEITRARGAEPAEPFEIVAEDRMRSEGMAVITSAAAGEDAQESDRLQGGVFTHHFVNGLRGAADSSGDSRVTLTEAYRYTYARTVMTTSRAPELQHPSYAFELRGEDDLVLTELTSTASYGRLRLEEAGDYVLFDPRNPDVVLEFEVAEGGIVLVPEGKYVVRRRLPDRVYQARVDVEADQVHDVKRGDLVQQSLGTTARRGTSERLAATAVQLGGGLHAPPSGGLGPMPTTTLGLRVDTRGLTVVSGVEGALRATDGEHLGIQTTTLSGQLTAFRLADVGPVALGLGLRGGTSVVWQSFETSGVAEDRRTIAPFFGPAARVELPLGGRLVLGLTPVLDVGLFPPEEQGRAVANPMPGLTVDVGAYVR